MAIINGVKGVPRLLVKLRAKERRYAAGVQRGLARAGLLLLRLSKELVPVDYGPLKASGYTRRRPGTSGIATVQEVGYTAEYAIYVHEIPEPFVTHGTSFNIKHWAEIAARPKTGPYRHARGHTQVYKFLEQPMRRHRDELRAEVVGEVRP